MSEVLGLIKKSSTTSEVKSFDDETGTVTALVNTLGVIDADGDRVMAGAFDKSLEELETKTVAVLWGHQPSETVGKVIDGQEVSLGDGKSALYVTMLMNLKTSRGRDAYEDLKFNGGIVREWSVGFNVPTGELEYVTDPDGTKVANIKTVELVEVSAVLRGASPGTTTISIKSSEKEKGAIPPHDTETTAWNTPWQGGEAVAALPDADEAAYKRMFAYVSSGENPEAKSSYRFPHHEWARAEDVGAANIRACVTGIAVLNGGMGGSDIEQSAIAGVYRHLADHIRDADREPPELKAELPGYPDKFTSRSEAEERALEMGCSGAHSMQGESGRTFWMPCENHDIYESFQHSTPSGNTYAQDLEVTKEHTELSAATTRLKHAVAARIIRVRIKWLNGKNKK